MLNDMFFVAPRQFAWPPFNAIEFMRVCPGRTERRTRTIAARTLRACSSVRWDKPASAALSLEVWPTAAYRACTRCCFQPHGLRTA